ncbi:MAG: alpha/beta hydrolase [Archangium sp.]|nr:alpha/beta hydrolase [Archangium sp.]
MALTLLAIVATLYLGLCGLLFVVQRSLLFPAPKELATPVDLERVQIPDGTFVLARWAPGDGPVVVHFHGNGEQVAHLSWLGQAWAEHGCSFVAVEYPGYPGAPGEPSEESLTAAADAALRHLTGAMKVDRSRLVLEGQSVGTGVAVAMLEKGWGTRLVLLSPYTSLPDVAASVFGWLPVRLLMRDRFDSRSRAGAVKVPTLIIHGTDDEVIPFALGKELSALIPGAKFIAAQGRHHNDLWDDEAVQDGVFSFVSEP